jgi:hypothetical protein
MIEKLKLTFENYENSAFFIDCVNEGFIKSGQKEKNVRWFVNRHFQQYDECDYIQLKKCAAHWHNIQVDKLNQFDFLNYKMSVLTLSNYRIVLKVMESYQNNY